uniref:Uncharacterized protein n=1 Tax=viral metagenome TaxID=1070528 RepID=A0A6C0DQJ8_9ZZZZ
MSTAIVVDPEYVFTSDYNIAVKPQKVADGLYEDSEYIYIKQNFDIREESPLFNLIKSQFIIKDGEETIKRVIKKKVLGVLRNRLVTNQYDRYKFHRMIYDLRYVKNEEGEYDITEATENEKNENDCLKFGECLTVANYTNDISFFNKQIEQSEGPPVLKPRDAYPEFTALFGEESDEKNIEILSHIPENKKDNNAVPSEGELYAIVRDNYEKGVDENKSPYHIAYVLYSHKGVNVTLDVAADKKKKI